MELVHDRQLELHKSVPNDQLVTLTGKTDGEFAPRFASRMGYAFLKNIGLPMLACQTSADYIKTAVDLALDVALLTTVRQTLRARMTQSPLTDEARFVSEMESAYRAMWQDWINKPLN